MSEATAATIVTLTANPSYESPGLRSICSLEGAITMARVQRSTHPLDVVLTHVLPLLERP